MFKLQRNHRRHWACSRSTKKMPLLLSPLRVVFSWFEKRKKLFPDGPGFITVVTFHARRAKRRKFHARVSSARSEKDVRGHYSPSATHIKFLQLSHAKRVHNAERISPRTLPVRFVRLRKQLSVEGHRRVFPNCVFLLQFHNKGLEYQYYCHSNQYPSEDVFDGLRF